MGFYQKFIFKLNMVNLACELKLNCRDLRHPLRVSKKLRHLAILISENCMILASVVLSQYTRVKLNVELVQSLYIRLAYTSLDADSF